MNYSNTSIDVTAAAVACCDLRAILLLGFRCLDLVVVECCGCVVVLFDDPFDELAMSTFSSWRRCNFAFFEH